jgi:ATP-dependent helicase HrpA
LESDRPTTQQFPDYLHNGELRLATSYRFDPSHDQDGATVKIPVQALPKLMKIYGRGAFRAGVWI